MKRTAGIGERFKVILLVISKVNIFSFDVLAQVPTQFSKITISTTFMADLKSFFVVVFHSAIPLAKAIISLSSLRLVVSFRFRAADVDAWCMSEV